MSKTQTVLVSVRYPLTAQSIQTLEHANQLARSHDDAHLYVLHVNLFQNGGTTHKAEITAAIAPFFDDCTPEVIVRRGFLVEEVISAEAAYLDADVVVLGRTRKATWRRLLSRALGNDPAIATHLRDQTPGAVEVVG